jgi:hypothetical protein
MQNLRFYVSIICLILYSCTSEYSLPIKLDSDYWEGEKPVIIAQFAVGNKGELSIQNTFSPISDNLPEPKYIEDKKVYIIQDNVLFDSMIYDPTKFRYISNKIIDGNHHYQLIIPNHKDSIISKSIFIPDEKIVLNKVNLSVKDSLLSGDIFFYIENFLEGYATLRAQFTGPELYRMKVNNSKLLKQEPQSCFIKFDQVKISCVANDSIYLGITELFLHERYSLSKYDSLNIFFEYISEDLAVILDANKYDGHEFGTNNTFVSSFRNAYGIFGYRHQFQQSLPLIK